MEFVLELIYHFESYILPKNQAEMSRNVQNSFKLPVKCLR
jgi:hypothetical protein